MSNDTKRLSIDEVTGMVAELAGLTKKDTKIVINAYGDVLSRELANGSKVYVPEVGTLSTRQRKVLTGGPKVPAKDRKTAEVTVVAFKASKGLKEKVRQ